MNKHLFTVIISTLSIFLFVTMPSCRKDTNQPSSRTMQYVLYTTKDFSHDHDTIRFRLFMNYRGTKPIYGPQQPLLDSSLAPMTIAAIPDSLHRLVFTKLVPAGHDHDTLLAMILYSIDNVGDSWSPIAISLPGQTTQTLNYNFQ